MHRSVRRTNTSDVRGGTAFSRRTFLKAGVMIGGAAAAIPVLSACGSESANSEGRVLRVRNPGGQRQASLDKNVWQQFTKETGIRIEPVTMNVAKLLAGLKAGTAGLDVIDAGAINLESIRAVGGLEKLDANKLFERTSADDLIEKNEYWVGADVSGEVLTYNTNTYSSGGPDSWADFWDVSAWEGRRSLMDATAEKPALEQALIADGVSLTDIYPLDVDRAFAKLAEIKPHILKFWTSAAEAEQLASSQQVDMLQMWSGRSASLERAGAPVVSVMNQAALEFVGLGIVKGSPMVDAGMTYIDFVCQPEVQARFISEFPNSPGNRRAFEYVKDDKLIGILPTSPTNIDKTFKVDYRWWAENQSKIQALWQQFLLK